MKPLRPLALLAALVALAITPTLAFAEADGSESQAPLPQTEKLAATDEYDAVLDVLKPLEANKKCSTKGGKKVCKYQKLSQDDYEEASASASDVMDELKALVEAREQDRSQALSDWRQLREDFLTGPINERYASVQEYNGAWLDGGNYTCYAGGGFSNCPAGVASGSDAPINITGNPADNGKGMSDLIEEKRQGDVTGLTQLNKEGRLARCAASKTFGDAALKDAAADVKKAKGAKKKKAASDRLKRLQGQRAACDKRAKSNAAPSEDDSAAVDEMADEALQDAQDNKDSMDEANDSWRDSASNAADRDLTRGENRSERAIEKANRADENAYDKLERRASRALARVEPA